MGSKIKISNNGEIEVSLSKQGNQLITFKGIVDERNGVDFGGTVSDFCLQAVYTFGVKAAVYILNKNPKNLQEFLTRYSHLCNLDKFVVPDNVDKSRLKELAIVANVMLLYAKLVGLGNPNDVIKNSPYKDFLPDLHAMFADMFPKYGKKNVDYIKEAFPTVLKYLKSFQCVENLPIEIVCEIWASSLALMVSEHEETMDLKKDPGFMEATFALPISLSYVSKYAGYSMAVEKYAQKQTFYKDCVAPNTRKSKTLVGAYLAIQESDLEIAKKRVKQICDTSYNKLSTTQLESKINELIKEYEQSMDKYPDEIASILIRNGYDMSSSISKNDILLAMQTRGAFGAYNGEDDKNNYNKFVADITVSVLSRKYNELLLSNEKLVKKSRENKVSYDSKMAEMEKNIENLRKEKDELLGKIQQASTKDGKKDAKIQSLEEKVMASELEIDLKDAEIASLRRQLEIASNKNKESEDKEESCVVDYKDKLSKFSKEHSVVIVGGHPNLVSKLRSEFKDIVFILAGEKSKITNELVGNASVVLYKTDNLGHSTWFCANSKCKALGTPEAYLSSVTNVGALTRNICESIESTLGLEM